ncbi:MAG TPA: NADPH-dependent F420 reductase [Polyangiaceae bacterium]|jgi:NADPH-dependent F420 reductase|nr:NADPH-dependent F420 reductase [Polyangiaceae bacterium]
MIVGILGGTGKEGAALALRLAKAGYAIVIGSRDKTRAVDKAGEVATASGGDVTGGSNAEAAERAAIVIVAVPFAGHRQLLEELKSLLASKTVIDTVVPLDFKAAHTYAPPPEGSAAEEARAVLGPGSRVVAALHQIAAHELAALDHAIEADGFFCGDDGSAKEEAAALIRALGVRPVDAGALKNAPILEAMTPLLIEINKRHKVKSSGIKITGI